MTIPISYGKGVEIPPPSGIASDVTKEVTPIPPPLFHTHILYENMCNYENTVKRDIDDREACRHVWCAWTYNSHPEGEVHMLWRKCYLCSLEEYV